MCVRVCVCACVCRGEWTWVWFGGVCVCMCVCVGFVCLGRVCVCARARIFQYAYKNTPLSPEGVETEVDTMLRTVECYPAA